LILDNTLFYATAGNQIHDTGTIMVNKQNYLVTNVEKENDVYYHFVEPKPTENLIGQPIKGKINWERRYSVMKAHTAQHIVSAIMMKRFQNKTLHANIKPNEFSVEFEQEVLREHLIEVLKEVNQIFTYNSKKIRTHVLNHLEATKKFSKKIRGKIPDEETVRILEVEDTDFNTCGGTHVRDTSEIGVIIASNVHREREVEFVLGKNALDKISICNLNQIFSQKQLNCTLEEFTDVFQKKLLELEFLHKKEKTDAILIMELLQTSLFEEINGIKTKFIEVELPKKIVFNEFKKFKPDHILLVKQSSNQFLILSTSKKYPAKMIVEELINIHGGRGGGSSLNAQILFENEPTNIHEDIKQILTN
jgi:Ser-tRNA(Ala) deacylase AlaX